MSNRVWQVQVIYIGSLLQIPSVYRWNLLDIICIQMESFEWGEVCIVMVVQIYMTFYDQKNYEQLHN